MPIGPLPSHLSSLVYGVLVGLLILSCEPERKPPLAVHVENLTYTLQPNGVRLIKGVLRNDSDQLLRTVRVQIALFDALNRRVAELTIDVKNVEPGTQKNFREAVRTDIEIRGAKLDRIFVL